jgi:hypothetical protein
MANYKVIAALAIRELTISIFGIDIKVTESLYRDPTRIKEARSQILGLKESVAALIDKRKAKDAADDRDAEVEGLEKLLGQAEFALASNERYQLCEVFSEQIKATDLVDDAGAALPLDPQGLFDSDVPTEMLQAILDAVNAVPLVPKAK